MFSVTRTQEIKITRGDDSGTFALEVNLGTSYEPMMYEFLHAFAIYSHSDNLDVTLDRDLFKKKATNDDLYRFEYNFKYDETYTKIQDSLGWYLNGERVNLFEWGLTYTGVVQIGNSISVSYFVKHISEVYFNVFDIHDLAECYYFQKIFRNDGKVITNTLCGKGYSTIKNYDTNIIQDGKLQLRINAEDTENLTPEEYRYQIKVKLYDRDKDEYIINTLTHPTAFYVQD